MTSMEVFKEFSIIFMSINTIGSVTVPTLSKGHVKIGNYPFMDMNNCGYLNPKDIPKPKIIGGTVATEGEFPWMASIHYKNISDSKLNDSFVCGGTLIHMDWVLTNNHCAHSLRSRQLKVYLGSVKRYEFYNVYDVSAIVSHPSMDLLLLRLKSPAHPVVMANHYVINTICLPKENILNNIHEEAIVSGFGVYDRRTGKGSLDLLKTVLLIDPYTDCLAKNYSNTSICGTEAEHMTCFGDSGSALVQFDGKRAVVIGIVEAGKTFTREKCGPGILDFARISLFIDWIKHVIEYKAKDQDLHQAKPLKKEPYPEPSQESKNNFGKRSKSETIVSLVSLQISILLFKLF